MLGLSNCKLKRRNEQATLQEGDSKVEMTMELVAFEDFAPGETRSYGDYLFTEEEIVAFAAAYDAQPFHLDAAAAKDTILGGLSASGWHTGSASMRMMVDGWMAETTCLAGLGVDEARWLAPVRPGDRLRARTETLGKTDLRSRPDAGIVAFATTLLNQADEKVMTLNSSVLFARRKPAETFAEAGPRPVRAPAPEPIDDPLGALPDDYQRARVGAFAQLGETHFTPELIREFAAKFDPLPFHMDEEAGRASVLGALSAAGWHTASCWMAHFIAFRQAAAGDKLLASRASPGFSNLAWRKPVLVGDKISYSTQIIAKRETSKPNLGLMQSRNKGVNQRGETVLEFDAAIFAPF